MSVTVTDLPRARGRLLRERLAAIRVRHRSRAAVAVALALAALVALSAPGAQRDRTSQPAGSGPVRVPAGERHAIATALGYPYPLRCLMITMSDSSVDYARANVERTNGCGRYRGYLNASLHRVHGAWRLVLDEGQLFVPNRLLAPSNRS